MSSVNILQKYASSKEKKVKNKKEWHQFFWNLYLNLNLVLQPSTATWYQNDSLKGCHTTIQYLFHQLCKHDATLSTSHSQCATSWSAKSVSTEIMSDGLSKSSECCVMKVLENC